MINAARHTRTGVCERILFRRDDIIGYSDSLCAAGAITKKEGSEGLAGLTGSGGLEGLKSAY